ncbi:MAG: type VI secretion system baseplate subunit TssE [Planctomycetaceae bacterium]|nr:type VI secretion system baseplate subunit TssE [Planctomycetaceae bacterium]
MTNPVNTDAAFPRPLLDRLMLGEEGRESSARVSHREYLEIIRRDLELLLDSRSRLTMREVTEAADPLSVSEYGLPDFTHLSVQSNDDLRLLAKAVKRVIASFESRLLDVEVHASVQGNSTVGLVVTARLAARGDEDFTMQHTLAIGG